MNKESAVAYRGILRLTFPIVAQNLLSAMVSSADIMMLNSVGQSAISAVSLASQFSGILYMIYYGLGTGITMLGAQYWGKGDTRAIELLEGIALRFSVGCSLLCFICAQVIPEWMMRIFTNDAELITLGISYLRLVAFSYLFWSISEVYLSALRSVERVVISTALNVFTLLLNICLNAVLIYGLFGAPKMGVAGVALATSLARGIQLCICLLVSRRSKDVRLIFRDAFVRNRILFQDFIHMALPALLNDLSWSVAFSMYSSILGHLGNDMVAANSIVVVVRNFATVMCFGFGSSCAIWLGKRIGQNDLEGAKQDSRRFMFLTILSGAAGGIMILLVSPLVLRYVQVSEQALYYMKYMLFMNSYYIMGAAVNTTLIGGVFRAGGDSRFGMICDSIDMWLYAVPVGFLSAFVFKLPSLWVYFLLCTDEFVKWPWVIRHYFSYQWLKNITKEYHEALS